MNRGRISRGGFLDLMNVRPSFLDDRIERRWGGDGDLAEHLAIQFNAGGNQRGNETAVVDATLFQGGIQARDPQAAEKSLLLLAMLVGVHVGFASELQSGAIIFTWLANEAAGTLENAFAFAGVLGAAFYTRHGSILSITSIRFSSQPVRAHGESSPA